MNVNKPLISILIPTYNQENYIQNTIRSALEQDYENLEVIVSDDCSSDKTYEIARNFRDERLEVYRNKTNRGRVKNYRKLLYQYANGKWVLMLDGDDYFTWNEYIRHCVNNYIFEPGLKIVFADAYKQKNGKKTRMNYNYPAIFNGKLIIKNFFETDAKIEHTTALYKKQPAREIDFYSQDIISSSTDSLLRLAAGGKVGFVDRPAAVWRINEESISQKDTLDNWLNNMQLPDSVGEFCLQKNYRRFSYIKQARPKLKYNWTKNFYIKLINEKRFKEARKLLDNVLDKI